MKIVFMGTPDFAAASLKAILAASDIEVAAVYCQPDRPAGRGQKLVTGPVKNLALTHNIPVYQPLNFKDKAELETLRSFEADIFVVAAYGLILPQALLDIPPYGAINVHSSLLPEYRGAAPIQRAVMNGDIRSGVTIMQVELKLDSGPILLQKAIGVGIDQTAGELHDELAELGGNMVVEALGRIREGRISRVVQDESRVTYAAKLSKADGILDFTQSARAVHNQARGVSPWPGAQLTLKRQDATGKNLDDLKILVEQGCVLDESAKAPQDEVGKVLPMQDGVIPIQCAKGIYGLKRLRPSGGKSMEAVAFNNGYLKNCIGIHSA